MDAGKTTLNEALLYRAGVVRTLGSVNAKDSHLDHYALERQRGITIYAKQARIVHDGVELTLLDTPGHVDFSSEVERTLPVLDYALLVIDGNDGVRGHAMTLWRLLERYHVPTIVFVNKMDTALRSREEIIGELSLRLSNACIDFTDFSAPTSREDGPAQNRDLSTGHKPLQKRESSQRHDDPQERGSSQEHDNTSIPPALAEACAGEDDAALEEFFETDTLSLATMQRLVTERSIFPCFFGSAQKQTGVDELVDALTLLAQEQIFPTDFGARVFKVSHDSSGARLTWVKVVGGVLEVRQPIEQPSKPGSEPITQKIDQIRFYTGGKFESSARAEAGQICAITGLDHTKPGMVLGCAAAGAPSRGERTGIAPSTVQSSERRDLSNRAELDSERDSYQPVLVPAFSSSVILNGNDAHKVHAALAQLTDEDPLLNVQWNERLQELQVQLMGTIQLEIVQATLQERFDLNVDFGPSGVLYRETIEAPVTGIGHFEPLRHYAEVHLQLEPLPAGSGMVFGTRCHVDELDLNWQRLILTNAMEREHAGVLIGSPLTDVRVTLIGGRAHAKHTEGGDFRQATYRAIRQGLMQARSVLLEPWFRFSLRVPASLVGRALSDLQRMCAQFEAPRTEGESALVEGTVPAKEIRDYAVQLGSYTHGEGSLALEFHAYDRCHDTDSVIAEAAYDPEADIAFTPDSVFCEHGAGRTVKWDEVAQIAHVKPDPATFTSWREATPEFFGK